MARDLHYPYVLEIRLTEEDGKAFEAMRKKRRVKKGELGRELLHKALERF